MNQALKSGLKQELNSIKIKTQKILENTKFLFVAISGWLLMVIATPYIAMNAPEKVPTLLTSLFACFIFICGTFFTKMGTEEFEKTSKEKSAGELLDDLELGTKEEGKLMMDSIKARSH